MPENLFIYRSAAVLALGLFLGGAAFQFFRYLRPGTAFYLKSPKSGNMRKTRFRFMLSQAALMPGLFKSKRLVWLPAFISHICLFILFISHLRLFIPHPPLWVINTAALSPWAGWALAGSLFALLLARIWSRERPMTGLRDKISWLVLLAAVISGIYLRAFDRADLVTIQYIFTGQTTIAPLAEPGGAWPAHFASGLLVVALAPFSRLAHGLGLFLNPLLLKRSSSKAKGGAGV